MRPEERIMGDVRRRPISNPFDAYFLLSRDETNIERDYEISTGISNFIIDNITTTKMEGNPLSYDLTDFRNRYLIYSGSSFSSIEFYTIFFPASRLSWYKVIGVPKQNQLDEKINMTSNTLRNVKSDLEKLNGKLSALKSDTDNLINMISAFMSKEPYKSFIDLTKKWQNDTGKINSDVAPDGSRAINKLRNEVYNIESTSPEFPNSK